MSDETAEALADFRSFNYDRIYLRPDSRDQAAAVVAVLRRLVDGLIDTGSSVLDAVEYVAGMTDRFAFDLAVRSFDYPVELLPRGIDAYMSND